MLCKPGIIADSAGVIFGNSAQGFRQVDGKTTAGAADGAERQAPVSETISASVEVA